MARITLKQLGENIINTLETRLGLKLDSVGSNITTEIITKIDEKIDDLALAVKKGFDHTDEQFKGVISDITILKTDSSLLKQGQEDINLKLDHVAYKFEVTNLKTRVDKIEKKIGIED